MATPGRKKLVLMHSLTYLLVLFVMLAALKIADVLMPLPSGAGTGLYPPGQRVIYKTSEFDVVTSINKFGFRGDEQVVKNGQILAFGDSFTFGFGLGDGETWPRLLETGLKNENYNLEVYNFGLPGSDTINQTELAKRYVKELKPKIVIFSVLLGDDFEQVSERVAIEDQEAGLSKIKNLFKFIYPTMSAYLARIKAGGWSWPTGNEGLVVVTESWKSEAPRFLKETDNDIPVDVSRKLLAGDLNPYLIDLANRFPNRYGPFWSRTLLKGSTEARALAEIEQELREVNSLVNANGGKMIIFAMPNPVFVRSRAFENYKKYGFNLAPEHLVTKEPELALEGLANRIGCSFLPSLAYARDTKVDIFFEYDGHLNPEGSKLVAGLLQSAILQD